MHAHTRAHTHMHMHTHIHALFKKKKGKILMSKIQAGKKIGKLTQW